MVMHLRKFLLTLLLKSCWNRKFQVAFHSFLILYELFESTTILENSTHLIQNQNPIILL